jgi:hypothetical protein
MKLLVKLIVVAVLANACYRVGTEYLTYFRFRDAVHGAMLFGPRDEAALRARILELAAAYRVPVQAQALTIRRGDRTVHVEGFYERAVEIAPSYTRPWRFAWSLDVVPSGAAGL